jgi:radical SAM protein with 4Fe4S-binding SPASM domain
MKHRVEHFGAWIRVHDNTLVAVDRELARSLHIKDNGLWNDRVAPPHSLPLEVHVAVTSRCPADCSGCYQSATRDGEDVALETLAQRLDDIARMGAFTVAFGGGEPALRDDLGVIARMARDRGLVPVVTTSGIGVNAERARALRDFAQVNVSHDGVAGGYAAVRGFDGEAIADRAVRALVEAGVRVGINHVLTRQNVDALSATLQHTRMLGASEIQLLRYKPAGRAASLEYLTRRLTNAQSRTLGESLSVLAAQHEGHLSIRIDCAMIPLVSESLGDAETLARFGVFGCEAGRHLGAIRRDGTLVGCSFVTEGPAHTTPASERWHNAPELMRFRDSVRAPEEPCASCNVHSVCRGGCRIVSNHISGTYGPDPECPKVVQWTAAKYRSA